MPAQADESREELSRANLLKVSGALLTLCAILFAIAVTLGIYIAWDKHRIDALEGSLLAQHQLQEALLANQASDHAPFPHIDPGISYVLNPAMKEATWHTGPDMPYRINRIGLRGPEIAPVSPGAKRIALVGDSVLFGWKLHDHEKLASLMQEMANERLGAGKYEFVTIALPGWNTIDQDRFLRTHLRRIDPDYIIWSIIRNDLLDSPGVVPPGIIMSWNSPQKKRLQPFQFVAPAELRDSPAPSIMARWRSNLQRIDAFGHDHSIPISLLWWRDRQRLLFDYVTAQTDLTLPVAFIPGQFRYDEKNWCVEYPDCHPTLWANEHLAIGLTGELIKRGAMDAINWSKKERAILDAFESSANRRSSGAERQSFMEEQAARVSDHFSPTGSGSVLYGVRQGKMGQNGMLLLRKEGKNLSLSMNILTEQTPSVPVQGIEIKVSNDKGLVAKKYAVLESKDSTIEIDVLGGADYDLYEVEWLFDHTECQSPNACFSAELASAQLRPSAIGAD